MIQIFETKDILSRPVLFIVGDNFKVLARLPKKKIKGFPVEPFIKLLKEQTDKNDILDIMHKAGFVKIKATQERAVS